MYLFSHPFNDAQLPTLSSEILKFLFKRGFRYFILNIFTLYGML